MSKYGGRWKSPRIKACAMDGTKEIMRDVFMQQKLVLIILHGRKMMDSASKKRCTSELLPVAFSVPSTATTSFLRTPFVFPLPLVSPMQAMVYFVYLHTLYYA